MGKETKIGLAVIAILLVTFGVVLAKRLAAPSDSPLVLLSSDQPPIDTTTGGVDANNSVPTVRKTKIATPEKITVMAAKAAPTESSGKATLTDLGQWTVAGNSRNAPAKQSDRAAKLPPPPLMPKLQTVATDPYSAPRPSQSTGPKPGQVQALADMDSTPKTANPEPFPMPSTPTATVSYPRLASSGDNYTAPDYSTRDRGEMSAPADSYRSRDYETDQRSRYSRSDSPQRPSSSYAEDSRNSFSMTPPSTPISTYTSRRTTASATGLSSRIVRDAGGNYVVQPNDSYWTISQKVYGTGAYFRALAEQNGRLVPDADKLNVGDAIRTPNREELERIYPDLCPDPKHLQAPRGRFTPVSTSASYAGGRSYVVEEGDTLYNIARYELGMASRWAEIYELNRDRLGEDFDYLTPGTKLVLPDDGDKGNFTRRPNDAVNR